MQGKKLLHLFLIGLFACSQAPVDDFYSTDFFREVQLQPVFPDSKTFVDCIPKRHLKDILQDYHDKKLRERFNLGHFVLDNFELPRRPQSSFVADTTITLEQHLTNLWSILTRDADRGERNSSLLPLPHPYVVPGGRFSEIYYWDSYFTMLGLKAQGRYDLMRNMINNFAYLIDSLGFIPNGNRIYYLSRSQPPFFSLMVKELESIDSLAALNYLPALEKEYEFWMNGKAQLHKPGDVLNHVVMLPDGNVMNRYWDYMPRPRPEAFKEDMRVSKNSPRNEEEIFRNIRAAAESGWDFSTRWFEDGGNLESIRTVEFVPVDLNCLLFHLEKMIAKGNRLQGDSLKAKEFENLSQKRVKSILTFCWNDRQDFFFDYNFIDRSTSEVMSLAGVYPLFFKIAPHDKALEVASVVGDQFLKPGGFVTTLTSSGQQWDAPNGWAPLQWITCQGLKNYDQSDLADEGEKRWIRQNIRVFKHTGKMMEKYNVMDTTLTAGGGEYPNQDGFGWTNGVALAFLSDN